MKTSVWSVCLLSLGSAMNHTSSKLRSATLAALVLAGLTTSASAGRSVSAFAGIAQHPENATCFNNAWGTIINNGCPNNPNRLEFCIPLVYDSNTFGTSANVTATVNAPNGTLMTCHTDVTDKNGTFLYGSGALNAPMNGSFQDIRMSGGGIPGGGAAYTCCWVPPGGTIAVINY